MALMTPHSPPHMLCVLACSALFRILLHLYHKESTLPLHCTSFHHPQLLSLYIYPLCRIPAVHTWFLLLLLALLHRNFWADFSAPEFGKRRHFYPPHTSCLRLELPSDMRFSWAVFSVIAAVFLLAAAVSAVGVVDNNGIGFNSDIASSNRKLKEVMGKGGRKMVESSELDDYGPNDPSPVSKVIEPGPIEHGTPLMPFLPNPAPPPPQLGG